MAVSCFGKCLRMLHISVSLKVITVIFILCQSVFSQNLKDIPTVFPSRFKPPGLNSPDKLWWAKEITPDFHVCGRLSRRNLRLAKDAGFRSILSLFTYPTGDPEGDFGGDDLPITGQEKEFVTKTLGLQFINLLDPMDEWSDVQTIKKFTSIVPHLKTPALLRCDRGYTIAFVTLLYLANQTRYDPDFQPKINSGNFYEISASMGLDFLSRIPMEVVSEVTGDSIPDKHMQALLKPRFNPEDWLDYWFAHAVYDNWFIAGQIEVSHLGPLKEFMYRSVINLRKGLRHKGVASQEEVNLLNIKSYTGTYGDGSILPRQNIERLKETRIEDDSRSSFFNASSKLNFEVQNPIEFGDGMGYNEDLERRAVLDSGLDYFHFPLGDTIEELDSFFGRYKDQLLDIGSRGPVLVHCSDASRAAYVTVLAAAVQHNLSLEWSLQRLKEMGFGVALDSRPEVFHVYKKLLAKITVDSLHREL